jgi:hypothetical protein
LTVSPPMSPTSSRLGERLGNQTPKIHVCPEYDRTLGGEVVDFMAEVGKPLDPWQGLAVRDAFAFDRQFPELWAAFEVLDLVARQNGKGGITEAIELGSLFLFRESLLFHSAHQFKTSTAAFRRLIDIIDGSDWLTKRVASVSRSKGDESINLTPKAGGGRLQFVARTLGSGRGLTGSKTIFDEAAWLTVGQYAAQTPGLATLRNPQIIYTSTPPDEDIGPLPEDAMLPSRRAAAHAGRGRIAIHEWSPPEHYDRRDKNVWYDCNPALGIRISEWFLQQQLDAFTEAGRPEKFDTEHLGLWPDSARAQWRTFSKDGWAAMADPESKRAGDVAIGVDISQDEAAAFIGLFGIREDGLEHVQLLDSRQGIDWVVGRLEELRDVVDPIGWAMGRGTFAALKAGLSKAGFKRPAKAEEPARGDVAVVIGPDMSAACRQLVEATRPVVDDEGNRSYLLRHCGQQELTAAAAGVMTKTVADSKAWSQQDSPVQIGPVVSASLARWLFHSWSHLIANDYDLMDSVI